MFTCSLVAVQSPSTERLTSTNMEGDGGDHRARETCVFKSGSPSIQDPYSLYKYDKVYNKLVVLQEENYIIVV